MTETTAKPASTTESKTPKKHGCLYGPLVFILFFTAISLFVEFAAPIRIESLIADQMRKSLNLSETPEVKISMHPLLYKLIIGRIDSVTVKVKDVDAKEGFTVETAKVQIKGIQFNPVRLLQTRQPSVDSIDEGQIRIVLSEKAVNDLVGGQLPGSTVKLEKDRIVYAGDLPYELPGFTFTLPGTVTVLPDNILLFKPTLEEITELPVPQEIKDYLANALSIEYRVLELPDGIVMTDVKIKPGKMTIDATIDSLDDIIQSASGGV